jgi:hypothetical protein
MDLDEIVDLLLESKDIYDFESFENVLNWKGYIFLFS